MSVSIGAEKDLSMNLTNDNAEILLLLLGFAELGLMNPDGVELTLFLERIKHARSILDSYQGVEFCRTPTLGTLDPSEQEGPMKYLGSGGVTVPQLKGYLDWLEEICGAAQERGIETIGWM